MLGEEGVMIEMGEGGEEGEEKGGYVGGGAVIGKLGSLVRLGGDKDVGAGEKDKEVGKEGAAGDAEGGHVEGEEQPRETSTKDSRTEDYGYGDASTYANTNSNSNSISNTDENDNHHLDVSAPEQPIHVPAEVDMQLIDDAQDENADEGTVEEESQTQTETHDRNWAYSTSLHEGKQPGRAQVDADVKTHEHAHAHAHAQTSAEDMVRVGGLEGERDGDDEEERSAGGKGREVLGVDDEDERG
ncbi:Nn.00g074300.m01.CDS01 [Neocucurbitaria sp. VM-36]